MMSMLLAITVRGTFVFLLTWLLDRAFCGRMSARSRRVWWVVVPVSFLLPVGLPLLPAPAADHDAVAEVLSRAADPGVYPDGAAATSAGIFSLSPGA